ncbi:MAG: hypothetical protein AAFY53_01060 [Pseudomonadota bacterium]
MMTRRMDAVVLGLALILFIAQVGWPRAVPAFGTDWQSLARASACLKADTASDACRDRLAGHAYAAILVAVSRGLAPVTRSLSEDVQKLGARPVEARGQSPYRPLALFAMNAVLAVFGLACIALAAFAVTGTTRASVLAIILATLAGRIGDAVYLPGSDCVTFAAMAGALGLGAIGLRSGSLWLVPAAFLLTIASWMVPTVAIVGLVLIGLAILRAPCVLHRASAVMVIAIGCVSATFLILALPGQSERTAWPGESQVRTLAQRVEFNVLADQPRVAAGLVVMNVAVVGETIANLFTSKAERNSLRLWYPTSPRGRAERRLRRLASKTPEPALQASKLAQELIGGGIKTVVASLFLIAELITKVGAGLGVIALALVGAAWKGSVGRTEGPPIRFLCLSAVGFVVVHAASYPPGDAFTAAWIIVPISLIAAVYRSV